MVATNNNDQMNRMFFTALYADRNNIPDDVKSKIMLSSLLPTQGINGILSTVVNIDQHREILDQKKNLEEQLKAKSIEAEKITRADKILVKWAKEIEQSSPDISDEIIISFARFLANYIAEVHNIKSLPPTFQDLPDPIKVGIGEKLSSLN